MAYTFSLPSVTDLSNDQKIALRAGRLADVLIISGCPGSGKTTVAIIRGKDKGDDNRYHYTVWANLLYGYLLNLTNQLNVSESYFSTFYSWFYTRYRRLVLTPNGPDIQLIKVLLETDTTTKYLELQLDEGQDLDINIRCALSNISEKLVICMDAAQDVNGNCNIEENEVSKTEEMLKAMNKSVQSFILKTNWRNTKPIFEFSRQIVPELNNQINVDGFAKMNGKKPEYIVLKDFEEIIEEIVQIIQNDPGRNIGIFDDRLGVLNTISSRLTLSKISNTRYDNREHKKRSPLDKKKFLKNMNNVVLATFISCKGLEFNTVIIVDISQLSDLITKKKGYYVGCTRAQERLILLKDLSKMATPNWFQSIDSTLYNEQKELSNLSPF